MLLSQLAHALVIDAAVIINAVRNDVVENTGLIDRRTVGQVTTVVQAHAQNDIARLAQCLIDCHICLCTRMRLYIGKLCPKQLAYTCDCQVFYLIDALTATVVALARITLGVLIGQNRTHCSQNCFADDIFRSDELNITHLTVVLFSNHRTYFRIEFADQVHCVLHHHTTSSSKQLRIVEIGDMPTEFNSYNDYYIFPRKCNYDSCYSVIFVTLYVSQPYSCIIFGNFPDSIFSFLL